MTWEIWNDSWSQIGFVKSMGKLHKSIAAFKWAPPKVSNQWCSQMQNMEIWEILWKIEQIHWILWSETKWQIGGAHRMAVSQHFVSEIECTQSKISTWDIYLSNFYQLFPVRDQMKAQEGVKVKFACFKGIVDPTDFQVSWGTWLHTTRKIHHLMVRWFLFKSNRFEMNSEVYS